MRSPCNVFIMKNQSFVFLPAVALALGVLATPSMAREKQKDAEPGEVRADPVSTGRHFGGTYQHGGGYYGDHYYSYRPRWNFGFGLYSWPFWGPHYYDYYTGKSPKNLAYTHPIYLETPRYVAGGLEIDVQRALAHKGYYSGAVDGDIGPQTQAAIRAFQRDSHSFVTGQINTALLRKLKLL